MSVGSSQSRRGEAPLRREHVVASRRWPSGCVPGVVYVRDVGLDRATDAAIWDFALARDLTIVSKDSDFHQISFVRGPTPKVIWIRQGNCTTADIEVLLRSNQAGNLAFGDDVETTGLRRLSGIAQAENAKTVL